VELVHRNICRVRNEAAALASSDGADVAAIGTRLGTSLIKRFAGREGPEYFTLAAMLKQRNVLGEPALLALLDETTPVLPRSVFARASERAAANHKILEVVLGGSPSAARALASTTRDSVSAFRR